MKTDIAKRVGGMAMAGVALSLLAACAGGGGGGAAAPAIPSPPPAVSGGSSGSCPAASSDLSGLFYCQLKNFSSSYRIDVDFPGGAGAGSSTPGSGSNSFPTTNPLNFASWGPWGANGDITAMPTGTLSPPSAIPQIGSAVYVGSAIGTASVSGDAPHQVEGSATITANFNPGFHNVEVDIKNNDGHELDFRNLTIFTSGSYYVGGITTNASVTGSSDACQGASGLVACASGKFYGPDGSETAGTFFSNLPGAGYSIRGSFGAKLCPADQTAC